jgi:hypothetical protein
VSERFIFGVPLIARAVARDWALVDRLLTLTLRSVLAQEDGDFHLVMAAHDRPTAWDVVADDARFELVLADWMPEPPNAPNDDGGAKKWLVKERVRAAGGGLLMFLDADDWVSRDLVARARAAVTPDHVGGVVSDGIALDWRSGRATRFPLPGPFAGPFHTLCGSSTVARVTPNSEDELGRDPHLVLGSHHQWPERAAELGVELAAIATTGLYMIGTGQNHSEYQSPVADWRRGITEAVRSEGVPLDAVTAAGFGQDLAMLPDWSVRSPS